MNYRLRSARYFHRLVFHFDPFGALWLNKNLGTSPARHLIEPVAGSIDPLAHLYQQVFYLPLLGVD